MRCTSIVAALPTLPYFATEYSTNLNYPSICSCTFFHGMIVSDEAFGLYQVEKAGALSQQWLSLLFPSLSFD